MIDLRSDTVTRPSPGMRKAMLEAEVGDDVWGDDPTVNRLQETLAAQAGKDAGLFFPSGTQSNLAAIMSHCDRGDEYIVGETAHTYKFEGGGAAVLGSVQPQPVENAPDGTLPLEKITEAIKPRDDHFARTRLLALENTKGGAVISPAYVAEATNLARAYGLRVHLDGARIFNAAVASNASLATLSEPFDTVSICFSKGLGAPVGSVLVGGREAIDRARRWRKVLGGGMRQAGVLAAACLYALEHNVERLAKDHENAEYLARGLAQIPEMEVLSQATNMVFARAPEAHAQKLSQYLEDQGILADMRKTPSARLVCHLDVSAADIEKVIGAVSSFFSMN